MRKCPRPDWYVGKMGTFLKLIALGGFQLTVGVSTPRLMVLYSVRKQAEQTMGIKAVSSIL